MAALNATLNSKTTLPRTLNIDGRPKNVGSPFRKVNVTS